MSAPIVFLDTETTGLAYDDEIWEIAAIRREPDGDETRMHLFVDHKDALCEQLPEPFRADHAARWPTGGYGGTGRVSQQNGVIQVAAFLRPTGGVKAHVVGAVPNFDTDRLQRLFRDNGVVWPAHHHLVDVENLAVGFIAAVGDRAIEEGHVSKQDRPTRLQPPWDSDVLSAAVGVDPSRFARHTAMGDAEWAMAIYDAVVSGGAR